jgi:hypothetical protein
MRILLVSLALVLYSHVKAYEDSCLNFSPFPKVIGSQNERTVLYSMDYNEVLDRVAVIGYTFDPSFCGPPPASFTNCTFASMYEGTFLELKWSQVLHDLDPQNINARIKFSNDGETLVAIGSKNMSVVVLSAQNGLAIASVKVPSVVSVFFNN